MLENVDDVMETMWIEEEPSIDDEIEPIETFVDFESGIGFKGFEALHNIVLDIDDWCSNGSRADVWWTTTIVWDISTKR